MVTPARRQTVLAARDLTRVWGRGDAAQTAVDRVDLDLGAAEIVVGDLFGSVAAGLGLAAARTSSGGS